MAGRFISDHVVVSSRCRAWPTGLGAGIGSATGSGTGAASATPTTAQRAMFEKGLITTTRCELESKGSYAYTIYRLFQP